MDVRQFLRAVLDQDEPLIRSFFHQDAVVNWHCTNEHFQLDEYSQIPYKQGLWLFLILDKDFRNSKSLIFQQSIYAYQRQAFPPG